MCLNGIKPNRFCGAKFEIRSIAVYPKMKATLYIDLSGNLLVRTINLTNSTGDKTGLCELVVTQFLDNDTMANET
jgi:hypothetical protein